MPLVRFKFSVSFLTRAYELATRIFELVTCEFDPATRGFELAIRIFELVTSGLNQ